MLKQLLCQLKVGADPEDDLRRGLLIRSIIDDPANIPKGRTVDPKTIAGKNAGPTGCVLMVDANRTLSAAGSAERSWRLLAYTTLMSICRGMGCASSCRVYEEARTPQTLVYRGADRTRRRRWTRRHPKSPKTLRNWCGYRRTRTQPCKPSLQNSRTTTFRLTQWIR